MTPKNIAEAARTSSGDAKAFAKAKSDSSLVRLCCEVFAVHDVLMLAYLFIVTCLLLLFGTGSHGAECTRRLYIGAAVIVLSCYGARANTVLPRRVRAFVYRFGLASVLLENYLMLRDVLPTLRPDNVDADLLAIDLRLFHVEPALWLERFNRVNVVEWFAFFYFSYFFICGLYLLMVVFATPGGRGTSEFAIGTFIVFCVGQLGYMAVPATGPTSFLRSSFHGPVEGGFFWHCVLRTVEAGSAMKDVFPSLHTAVPTWFAWFATERAKTDPRWRWPRNITLFFACNIVISTVLLRWHYAIDVFAGLALSSFAGWVSPRLAAKEEAWRASRGLRPVWQLGD